MKELWEVGVVGGVCGVIKGVSSVFRDWVLVLACETLVGLFVVEGLNVHQVEVCYVLLEQLVDLSV